MNKTFLLKIGDLCNNDCYFCAARREKYDRDFTHIARQIVMAAKSGHTALHISGLEPTIHPDFFKILEAARNVGFQDMTLDTNARMFAYKNFATRAAASGVTHIRALLVHHTAAGYRSITGSKKGFEQFVQGMKNISCLFDKTISLRIPICSKNAYELNNILIFADSLNISFCRAFFPRDYLFDDAPPDMQKIEDQIEKAHDFALSHGMVFEFDRTSRMYHCLSEMDERTSPCFYPTFYTGRTRRPETLEALLRPTFACNQICKFCWVDTSLKNPSPERMQSEIRYIINRHIPKLSFSGGEPTLSPRLPHYINAAKLGGVRMIEMHTNAMRLNDPALARTLKSAGLDMAFCTLLAADASVSDNITRTAGSFRKTLAGITNLLSAGVKVVLHNVVMGNNYTQLAEFVDFTDRQFSYAKFKIPITFSFVAPKDAKAMADGIVPRYSEAMPYLAEALSECQSRGIPFSAGEGLKGIPPCAIPFRDIYLKQIAVSPKNLAGNAFVKNKGCLTCDYDEICFGVRRFYSEYYGLDEIKPVRARNRREIAPVNCACDSEPCC